MYAEVIIEYPVKSLDKKFTYKIPNEFIGILSIGMKVFVPFGNQDVNGFVLNITDEFDGDYEMKYITNIIDKELVLSKELLKLGFYMKSITLCPLISAYQSMLPTSYKVKTKKQNYDIFDTFYKLIDDVDKVKKYIDNNKRSKKQIEILNVLLEKKKINRKDIPLNIIKVLLENELLIEEKVQKYRNLFQDVNYDINKLTEEQQNVVDSVNLKESNTYLLYGVTGSGKTEVYLDIIEKVLKDGKSAIMLTPEISLTMQIVKRFYARFKDNVAVFHSALSDGEKHDEYLRIMRGEVSVVVGTRSAIFTPLKNLGVIIIDEEHSDTYKQDTTPRYHAKDMAIFRSQYNNCPLILGSATPSFEAMARATKGVYKLLTLDKRIGSAVFPKVKLVDMTDEFKKGNQILSSELIISINERIEKDEQVIILLNRRGYSTFINCSSCGYVYKCPNCDISLTYHKTNNNLICHYCGYLTKKSELCPECNEDGLNYLGLGTEQVEEYISKNIINSKVIRMDQDTTSKKGSHDRIIESFRNKEFNILLGTQMISKGLDFKDVTLVGVINADSSLNIPDYKANENTFSLLNQVAGRSGRSEKKGEVILQTFNPDHLIFKHVINNDYLSFYKYEMQFRHKLGYPPYYFLTSIKVISKEYNDALAEAKNIVKYLKSNLSNDIVVLGPTTAAILKFNNLYRFQIIIKYKKDDKLKYVLKNLDMNYAQNKKVKIEMDVNPTRI